MEAKELLLNRFVIRLLAPKDQIKEVSGLRVLEDFFLRLIQKNLCEVIYIICSFVLLTQNVEISMLKQNLRGETLDIVKRTKSVNFLKTKGSVVLEREKRHK